MQQNFLQYELQQLSQQPLQLQQSSKQLSKQSNLSQRQSQQQPLSTEEYSFIRIEENSFIGS